MAKISLDSDSVKWFAIHDSSSTNETGPSVKELGVQYTSNGFRPTDWMSAEVPGTVLNTVLRDKDWLKANLKTTTEAPVSFYDPYFDQNVENIPDISEEGKGALYSYWFYTEIELETSTDFNRNWLSFRGMNYSADVFINGKAATESSLKGMFVRNQFDLTNFPSADQMTRIAVRIEPPNPPGIPSISRNGGNESPNIAQNVTMRFPVGWDWVFPMPDRCAGIWDEVAITQTNSLQIQHPHVKTTVLSDPKTLLDSPKIDISLEVNNASNAAVTSIIEYKIEGLEGSQEVTLQPGNNVVRFSTFDFPDAKLWWPHGSNPEGPTVKPHLYSLGLSVFIKDENGQKHLSDNHQMNVGVREVSIIDLEVKKGPVAAASANLSRQFHVNGAPIFLKGGNWMGVDMLFRFGAERYYDEVNFHREMNLNFIRVWGGGIIERPEFYDACDELGILVMQDFWFSGEVAPVMNDLYTKTFESCAIDSIKMLRNHPSLLFWCGANESEPPRDALNFLNACISNDPTQITTKDSTIPLLDDTRILVPNSLDISGISQRSEEKGDGQIEMGDGPYGIFHINTYFDWLPDDYRRGYWNNQFNPEIGSLGFPTEESMRRTFNDDALNPVPVELATCPVPLTRDPKASEVNYSLQLHRFSQEFINYDSEVCEPSELGTKKCISDQVYTYGAPQNSKQYSDRAQLASFLHYKTLWEGYLTHMWDYYTGMIIWKSQNPFPGLRAQLYDWYLEQTGGFWGVKSACEPIHLHLNLLNYPMNRDFPLVVVNQTANELTDLSFDWELYGIDGVLAKSGTTVALKNDLAAAFTTSNGGSLNLTNEIDKYADNVYFIRLNLKQRDIVVSTNFYWLSKNSEYHDLEAYQTKELSVSAKKTTSQEGERALKVTLTNSDSKVAFWNRLQVRKSNASGAVGDQNYIDPRVLPVRYENNYVSLLAGEEKTIEIHFKKSNLSGGQPELWLNSWNSEWRQIQIEE